MYLSFSDGSILVEKVILKSVFIENLLSDTQQNNTIFINISSIKIFNKLVLLDKLLENIDYSNVKRIDYILDIFNILHKVSNSYNSVIEMSHIISLADYLMIDDNLYNILCQYLGEYVCMPTIIKRYRNKNLITFKEYHDYLLNPYMFSYRPITKYEQRIEIYMSMHYTLIYDADNDTEFSIFCKKNFKYLEKDIWILRQLIMKI